MSIDLILCEKHNGLWNVVARVDGLIWVVQAVDKYEGMWAIVRCSRTPWAHPHYIEPKD